MNNNTYYNPEYKFVESLNLERGKSYFLKINFNQLVKIIYQYGKNYEELKDEILTNELIDKKTKWENFIHIVNKYKGFRATTDNKITWLDNMIQTYFLLKNIPENKRNKATLYFQLKVNNKNPFKYDKTYGIIDTSIEYNNKALVIEFTYINRFRNITNLVNKKQEQLDFYIANYSSDNYEINDISGTIYSSNLPKQKLETLEKIKKLFDLN